MRNRSNNTFQMLLAIATNICIVSFVGVVFAQSYAPALFA